MGHRTTTREGRPQGEPPASHAAITGRPAPARGVSRTVSACPSGLDTRAVDTSLAFNLRLASLRASQNLEPAFRDAGLSPVELVALSLIEANPGIRQGVLAATLFLKPAHMTKLVQTLLDGALIERTVPPADRRAVELWLTTKGESLATMHRRRVERLEAQVSAELLSDAEQRQLLKLLRKVWQTETRGEVEPEVDLA